MKIVLSSLFIVPLANKAAACSRIFLACLAPEYSLGSSLPKHTVFVESFFLFSQLPNFITKCHKYTSFYFCMVCIFKIIVKLYHYISTKRTQNRVLFVLFNWFIHHKIIVAPCHPGQSHYCHYFSVCMCLLLTKFKCHIIHIIIF